MRFDDAGLAALGLEVGDVVRFRPGPGQRWHQAVVARRERDGSVGLHDARGAARAIAAERLEVRRPGPRGGAAWVAVADLAATTEQLPLL